MKDWWVFGFFSAVFFIGALVEYWLRSPWFLVVLMKLFIGIYFANKTIGEDMW